MARDIVNPAGLSNLMKAKNIEIWLQVAAAGITLLAAMFYARMEYLFALYFAIGGVQFLGCIINKIFLPARFRMRSRKGYEILLLVITISAGILWMSNIGRGDDDFIIVLLLIMLVGSPIMAIWYFVMCTREWSLIKERGHKLEGMEDSLIFNDDPIEDELIEMEPEDGDETQVEQ